MNKLIWITVVVAGGILAPPLEAQETSGKTLTLSQATREDWNEVGRKLIAMAEDFPEDKYDYKPSPAQRSFAEQLLHVAGSNDLFTAVSKGQKPVDDEDRAHYKTKAAVVAYVEEVVCRGSGGDPEERRRGHDGEGGDSGVAYDGAAGDAGVWIGGALRRALRAAGGILSRGGDGASGVETEEVRAINRRQRLDCRREL